MRQWLLSLIERYQRRGGIDRFRVECNFEPSCSEYARQAISHYGIVRGLTVALRRIRRCNNRDQVGKFSDPFVGN